jgi:hypothetical protein
MEEHFSSQHIKDQGVMLGVRHAMENWQLMIGRLPQPFDLNKYFV